MNIYTVLTRFGDCFEVLASGIDEARFDAEAQIEIEGQNGDALHQITLTYDGDALDRPPSIARGIQDIRDDLAEIMAK